MCGVLGRLDAIEEHQTPQFGGPQMLGELSARHPCPGATTLWCQSELGPPGKWDLGCAAAQGRVSADECCGNPIDESAPAVPMSSFKTRGVPVNDRTLPGFPKPEFPGVLKVRGRSMERRLPG